MSERIKNLSGQLKTKMKLGAGVVIQKGEEFTREHTFTKGQNEELERLAGDTNPVDYEEIADKASLFGKEIVDGVLVIAYIINICGIAYPGCVMMRQSATFHKPVFIGEKFKCTVKMIDTDPEKRLITSENRVYRADGKLALVCEITCWVMNQNITIK